MVGLINMLILYSVLQNSFTNTKRDYCHLDQEHIVCERKDVNCTPAPHCYAEVQYFPLEMRELILDTFNRMRDKIAGGDTKYPQAANMRALRWCFELEHIAQCHSNLCRHYNKEFIYITKQYSANAVYGSSVSLKNRYNATWIKEKFESWFTKNYPLESVYNASSVETDLLALIGCAQVHAVGCGYSEGIDPDDNLECSFYVCVFAGVTNALSPLPCPYHRPLYKIGEPCSQCEGSWCNHRYTNLCGKIRPIRLEYGDRYRPGDRAGTFAAREPAIWILICSFLILKLY